LTPDTNVLFGTGGYNVFEAGLASNGAGNLVNTLNSSDRITGGTGVNTINVTLLADGNTVTPLSLANIQNINIQNQGSVNGTTLSLANAGQVTNINIQGTGASQVVNNIASASTQFGISNTTAGVTFDVVGSATTGSSDNAFLIAKGVNMAGGANGSLVINNAFETLTVNSVAYSASNTTNTLATDYSGDIILMDAGLY
jgi:hypothetical protein